MKAKPSNLPASINARLRNLARGKNTNLELLLRRYALERLLLRLSLSPHRNQFILKGAMLFTAWTGDPFRPTQDLDLLGFGDATVPAISKAFRAICQQTTDDDGLTFDIDGLSVETIRDNQFYGGARVKTVAFLGKARIPIQVDIGFGDAVTPKANSIEFPSLLHGVGPRLRAYPRETVVAEKFQAIVALGLPNSRMKDFYDLVALARLFPFKGRTLAAALGATFKRRGTPVPARRPVGLSATFSSDLLKVGQWNAFRRREHLLLEVPDLVSVTDEIAAFVMPPARAARADERFEMTWTPAGPWVPSR